MQKCAEQLVPLLIKHFLFFRYFLLTVKFLDIDYRYLIRQVKLCYIIYACITYIENYLQQYFKIIISLNKIAFENNYQNFSQNV